VFCTLGFVCAILWVISLIAPGGLLWTAAGVQWRSMRSPARQTSLWLRDNVSLSVRNHALFFVSNRTPAAYSGQRATVTTWRQFEVAGFEYSCGYMGTQPAPYVRLVRVPLLVLALGLLIWPAYALVGRLRCKRLAREGHCQGCGYDLTGNVSGVCPECGTPVAG